MLAITRSIRAIAVAAGLTAGAIAVAGCAGHAANAPAAPTTPPPAAGAHSAAATATAAGSGDSTAHLVHVHLIADVTRVGPGQEFTLAAVFEIAPGWHIYWRNPGDAGLLTRAAFHAPPGFQIRPVRYPGPQRFDAAGDVVTYGYRRRVLLSAPVVAPDRLGAGPLTFSATTSWLACRDGCVVGHANGKLTLAAATASAPSRPAHPALFALHRARLPQPLSELRGAKRSWKSAPGEVELVLRVPGTSAGGVFDLAFFPAANAGLVGQAATPADGGGRTLHLMFRPGTPAARGVLRVTAGSQVRYYAVDLTAPAGARAGDKRATSGHQPALGKENR